MNPTNTANDVKGPTLASVAVYATSFGNGWVTYDDQGILEMGLPGAAPHGRRVGVVPTEVAVLVGALERYWDGGELPAATPELVDRAASTPFMKRIYEVVADIPAGRTMTYADVADAAGRPHAARAVGAAMARNPYAPVIPCHRVVGSDGGLRGYGGGLRMKQRMLEMEARVG